MKDINKDSFLESYEKYKSIFSSSDSSIIITTGLIALFVFIILKFLVFRLMAKKLSSNNVWSKTFARTNFFEYFSYLFPFLIIDIGLSNIDFYKYLSKFLSVVIGLILILILLSGTKILEFWYKTLNFSKKYPINSYTQLARLIILLMGLIVLISILLGRSPVFLLSAAAGFGTLILIFFKDTLTSFVTGIQIAVDNLIQEDDWIVVPSLNADGVVVSVKLNFIQVRNWDNTIVNIPTYLLSTGSFSNWRNVFETGARRIMTSIPIDQKSVRVLTSDELKFIKTNRFLSEYIENEYFENPHKGVVNLTLFRNFIYKYLLNNSNLNKDFTCLVRLLDPTQYGIPVQIYCFSKVTSWIAYEKIKSEILEIVITASKEFKLEIFQVNLQLNDK